MKHFRQCFRSSNTQCCFSCGLPTAVVWPGKCTPACLRPCRTVSRRSGRPLVQQLGESSTASAALLADDFSCELCFPCCCFPDSPSFSHRANRCLHFPGGQMAPRVSPVCSPTNHQTPLWGDVAAHDSFACLLLRCCCSPRVWAKLFIFWIYIIFSLFCKTCAFAPTYCTFYLFVGTVYVGSEASSVITLFQPCGSCELKSGLQSQQQGSYPTYGTVLNALFYSPHPQSVFYEADN